MKTSRASREARRDSREAVVEAAQRLFLQRGYGAVSMDDLAQAAGVARRTLYNQFASKEEIFRAMLQDVSSQLEHALPPGIETSGDAEQVLHRIAQAIVQLHKQAGYVGFLRMVIADSRQFPWIAKALAAIMDPQTERLTRYLAHQTTLGFLDCGNPTLAAHQFMGILNEFTLWPLMVGRKSLSVPTDQVVDETVNIFLRRYARPSPNSPPSRSRR